MKLHYERSDKFLEYRCDSVVSMQTGIIQRVCPNLGEIAFLVGYDMFADFDLYLWLCRECSEILVKKNPVLAYYQRPFATFEVL